MRSGGDSRGSSASRRARKGFLLSKFGDGKTCPCHICGVELTFDSITVDRIVPGSRGGTYQRSNIRPACRKCNCARQDVGIRKYKAIHATIAA